MLRLVGRYKEQVMWLVRNSRIWTVLHAVASIIKHGRKQSEMVKNKI